MQDYNSNEYVFKKQLLMNNWPSTWDDSGSSIMAKILGSVWS